MQLVEKGVFTLDTPLDKLLDPQKDIDLQLDERYSGEKPNPANMELLKANAHRITVGDLLTHRSGLIAEGGPEHFFETIPNDKFPYSNYGYQLLATIVGKHSPNGDKTNPEAGFKKHIEQKVFTPAKMQGALDEMQNPFPIKPVRYNVEKGVRTVDEESEPSPHGNGCWKMHAKDLLLFGQAIRSNPELAKTAKTMIESDPPI